MSFPDKVYPDAGASVAGYRDALVATWQSVDAVALDRAMMLLDRTICAGRHRKETTACAGICT